VVDSADGSAVSPDTNIIFTTILLAHECPEADQVEDRGEEGTGGAGGAGDELEDAVD
jgi:hypothetical protein